ncbi:MAG: hypothetical protein NW226_15335 [Microscillaceae bacterium]|nr:hypothetical protein [Microscillaceae bacterium]
MTELFNTTAKQTIRRDWVKPFLKYLHDTINQKLVYLGLPDTEAHDIKEWLEFLDKIYAFQCREYPKSSYPEQSREKVLALENVLRSFERKKSIDTYDVYDGYIEEVVLRGYDNSPDRKDFFLKDVVTIYNLDFCGQVTSPIEYVDTQGNKKQAYKFDAVKKLLNTQASLPLLSKKFVLLLTVHCSYDGKELKEFQNNPPNQDIKDYISTTTNKRLSKGEKAPYWVKAFVYHNLTQFFTTNNFIPEFLPVIYYKGDNNHPLLFFTVIGTEVEGKSGAPNPPQKIVNFLYGKFLSINPETNEFENNEDLTVHEEKCKGWSNLNILHLFKQTKIFKSYWKS